MMDGMGFGAGEIYESLMPAVPVLVMASPCSFGLATPTLIVIPAICAIVKGIGLSATTWHADDDGGLAHPARAVALELHKGTK